MKQLLFSILLLSFASTALAEDTRYYDVEIIIFKNLSESAHQSEIWHETIEQKLPEVIIKIGDPYPGPIPPEFDPKLTFKPLKQNEYRLRKEAKAIESSETRQLLLHTAWRQPGLDKEKAIAIHIDKTLEQDQEQNQSTHDTAPLYNSSLGSYYPDNNTTRTSTNKLEGFIKIILSRYLHVDANLQYKTLQYKTPTSFFITEDFDSLTQPIIYRLKQTRRMRSKELHYLDHPILGMLTLITPFIPKTIDQSAALTTHKEVTSKKRIIKR